MQLWELFVLAVGLSMDAFAVAVCKGLAVQKAGWKHAATAGLWFGGFQAGMPLLGWALGVRFQAVIVNVDHWVAFVLLGIIGGNMVREGLCKKDECDNLGSSFSPKAMLPMALATSVDALAVGVTFAFLQVDIVPAVGFIGAVTFLLSAVGVQMGRVLGCRFKSRAELCGGVILILMGAKILLEHLGVLG